MEFKEFECFGVMSATSRLLDRTAARRILLVLTLPRDGRAEAEKTNSFKTEADSDMRDEEWEGKETRKKKEQQHHIMDGWGTIIARRKSHVTGIPTKRLGNWWWGGGLIQRAFSVLYA